MATAEESGATANTNTNTNTNTNNSTYGGGGAGGKFRKKPFRRQTTPYDRPPTAPRGTNNNTSSWLTKLVVDPASKLISYGAERFFASVFRKRLPPPPSPQSPEVKDDAGNGVQGAVFNNKIGAEEAAGGECSQHVNSSCSSRISELEHLLKQKTFTRSEINHLTELLKSRTLESLGNEGKKSDEPSSHFQRYQYSGSGPLGEDRTEGIRSSTANASPILNSKVLEDDIASPAELAKAYMGCRPSKVSPSVLGMRSQVGDTGLRSNTPFASKSPISLTMKTSVNLSAPENGTATPKSLGRSVIYNMARTPYFRVHPSSFLKGSGTNSNGYAGASMSPSSHSLVEHDGKFDSKKMTLKRRSSVLDDELGSVGPIRRIRQKSNLLAPRVRYTAHEAGSDAKQKLQLIGEPRRNVLKAVVENEIETVPNTSSARVPSKSMEVAARILQHLENLTPKGKSSETKFAEGGKSSLKLTASMLSGQALRSMENVGSIKLPLNLQDDHKVVGMSIATLPDARASNSQKQEKVEENGLKESVPSDTWNPVRNNDSVVSLNDPGSSSRPADSVVKNGVSQPPQKKRAFRMSAQEESSEQEDDVVCDGLTARPCPERRGPSKTPDADGKLEFAEETELAKPKIQPEVVSPSGLVSSQTNEPSSQGAAVPVLEGSSNGGFPASNQAAAASQSAALLPPSFIAFEKTKEAHNPPLFSLSSMVADKFPSLPSKSSSKGAESKLGSNSSLVNVSAITDSQMRTAQLDKVVPLNPLEAGDVNGKSDAVSSAESNGPFLSRPLVSFGAASSNATNETATGGALPWTSSTSIANIAPNGTGASTSTSTTSSGSIFGLDATPSILAGPVFRFGASADPSPSVSAVSTTMVSETVEAKTKGETNPSSGSSSSSHSTVAATSSGGSTFGLGGSSFSYSNANDPASSVFTGASKSLMSGAGTVSQGAYVQSVSSALLPSFSMNSSTTLDPSLSNPQVFNQNSTFGCSSSASSSDTSAVVPGSAPTSSVFKFGASSTGALDGNAVSSTTGATPGIFSFGFSSSTSSTSAAEVSSGATPPMFAFGGSSSASAAVNKAGTNSFSSGNSGAFNFGGSSLASSSAISSNSAPNVFSSSWQSPKSSIFGSAFTSQSPSTGFAFGALSASSAPANASPMLFNSSAGSSSSPFSFTTASASVSSSPSLPNPQPIFGNAQPGTGIAVSPGNNDQMNAEDSMAEDPVQSSIPSSVPVFGQPAVSPSTGFIFGSAVPSQTSPFMFGSQQTQVAPQNPSPFQSTSLSGSFSLGSGGGDKSGRKIVKINRNKNRKK